MTVPIRYITATLLLLVASLWTAAGAQGPSRGQTQGYVAPPTGQPDLQGVWRVENLARYDVEAHAARPGIPASRGVVVDPPDGRIPYRPEALQKRDENFRNSRNPDPWKSADPYHKCYSPGVPRLTYLGWPFQIYQTPKGRRLPLRVDASAADRVLRHEGPAGRRRRGVVERRFPCTLGGQHARRRRDEFQRPHMVRHGRQLSQ